MTGQKIHEAIALAVDDVNGMLPDAERLTFGPCLVLYGEGGGLDSLGLVNFIVSLEERINEKFGVALALADGDTMSSEKSPFINVNRLSAHLEKVLKSKGIN